MVAASLGGPSEEAVTEKAMEFLKRIEDCLEAGVPQTDLDGCFRVTLSFLSNSRLDRAAAEKVPTIWNMAGCGGLSAGPMCRAITIEASAERIEIVLQPNDQAFFDDDLG